MNSSSKPRKGIPLIERAQLHPDNPAVDAADGRFTYGELLSASAGVAGELLAGRPDLDGARIAFLVPPCFAHVAVQWGIWRAGGIAVPLCLDHPRPELEYVIDDIDAEILVADPPLTERLRPIAEKLGNRLVPTSELLAVSVPEQGELPTVDPERPAMIVYTSGTTSRPKGVVSSHRIIQAQIVSRFRSTFIEWQVIAVVDQHPEGIVGTDFQPAQVNFKPLERAIQFKVEKVRTRLKRYHPDVAELEIKLTHLDKVNEYECNLVLKAFRETLCAKKGATELRVAVDKSFDALMKELDHYRIKLNKSLQSST